MGSGGLQGLSELALQREIVQPLLKRLGFTAIRDTSGPQEKGKDIVAILGDVLGAPKLCAIQLKKFKASAKAGSSSSLGVLLDQLRQASQELTLDPLTDTHRIPDRVIFVTPYPIPTRVREAFHARLVSSDLRNVELLDGDRLLELISKHAPELLARFDLTTQYRLLAGREAARAPETSTALQLSGGIDLSRTYVQLSFGESRGPQVALTTAGRIRALRVPAQESLEIADIVAHHIRDRERIGHATIPRELTVLLEPLYSTAAAYRNRLGELADPKVSVEACEEISQSGIAIQSCAIALFNHRFVRSNWEKLVPAGTSLKPHATYSVALQNLLKSRKSVVVMGGPGAGKSTLLKRIVGNIVANDAISLPIFVRLIDVESPTVASILEACVRVLSLHGLTTERKSLKPLLEEKLAAGSIVLCLDGLDEAGAKAVDLWRAIQGLSARFPRSKVIVSCRDSLPIDWTGVLGVYLASFDDKQLKAFTKNWFAVESNREVLEKWLVARPAMRDLARTPLIAALLCSLVDARAELPDSESELYSCRFDLLLGKWDRAKGIVTLVDGVRRRYSYFLQVLAMQLHNEERREVYFSDAAATARRFAVKGLHSGADELVEDCVRRGVLERQIGGELSFGHLTNQEFLAARWLVRENDVAFVWSRLLQPWWEKTLDFYAKGVEDLTTLLNYGSRYLREETSSKRVERLLSLAPLTSERAIKRFLADSNRGRRQFYDWTRPAPALNLS